MRNLTIKHKLITLISVISSIFLFLCISFFISLNKINLMHEGIISAKNIESIMLEMRKSEKDFIMRESINSLYFEQGKSKYLANFDSLNLLINKQIEEIEANRFLNDELIKSNMVNVRQHLKMYAEAFHRLTEKIKAKGYKDFGIEGAFRNAVHQLGKNLTGKYEIEILKLRKDEKDFLLRKENSYVDAVNSRIAGLKQMIGADDVQNQNLLGDYQKEFAAMVNIMKEIGITENDGITGEMREAVKQSEPVIDETHKYIEQLVDKGIVKAELIMTILVIAGLIIAIAIGLYIIRGINLSLGGDTKEVSEIAANIASGNLLFDIKPYSGRTGALKSLYHMTQSLRTIVTNIVESAGNIASASEQMRGTSQSLSQGANEQASSVEEVSATMEEMTSITEQNSQNSIQTEKTSKAVNDSIKRISSQSIQAVEANRTISEKIKIINDIAFQTNILALNAAVEAARAGENGKGFAVVASEVRKLAERSKIAADEIITLSAKSLNLTEDLGKQMKEIIPEIERTTGMVQEISSASTEQSNGANQVNSAVQQLNNVTQQNAAASEELSSSAEELANQAEQLKEIISYFRV